MPDAISYDRVALRYTGAAADAVGPVSFDLREGERVLLLGTSGAGKSSLLHAATGLLPASIPGEREGEIRIGGQPVDSRRPAEWADAVGYLFQDADQTLAGFTVADEVAFGLENRGVEPGGMPGMVAEAMTRAGLPPDWGDRRIATLSGGERQCVALASLVAQGAAVTLADEPAASLAPQAARRMADLLLAPGRTTLLVEHRPGPYLDRLDRCLALRSDGAAMASGSPEAVFLGDPGALAAEGIALPLALRLHLGLPEAIAPRLSVEEAMSGFRATGPDLGTLRDLVLPDAARPGEPLVTLRDAACAPPFGPVVLRDVSMTIRTGEVLAILGPNGAGKSTLAACLAGLLPPRAGKRTGAPGAVAFQNPEAHFSRESVRAEIAGLDLPEGAGGAVLERWRLGAVADQHPFTLSQGQKRRLALALLTETGRWPLVILDEPTNGLDGASAEALGTRIRALAREGRGVAVITHDLDFALRVADRAVLVAGGGLQFDGPCATLMRDTGRLTAAGLLPAEAAPLLHWLE
jgi:energy-coupling factor transport system ATP-binding protein